MRFIVPSQIVSLSYGGGYYVSISCNKHLLMMATTINQPEVHSQQKCKNLAHGLSFILPACHACLVHMVSTSAVQECHPRAAHQLDKQSSRAHCRCMKGYPCAAQSAGQTIQLCSLQMRERLSMRCPSAAAASGIPLLRCWGVQPSLEEEKEERERERHRQQLSTRLQQREALTDLTAAGSSSSLLHGVGQHGFHDAASEEGHLDVHTSASSPATVGGVRRRAVGARWLLFPPSGSSRLAKLSGSSQAPGSRAVESCWTWRPGQSSQRVRWEVFSSEGERREVFSEGKRQDAGEGL